MRYIAKTLYGLEEILASELKTLGAEEVIILNRAVSFQGPRSLLYRVNYNSRLALSVLQPVAEFSITGRNDLYNGAVQDLLAVDDPLIAGGFPDTLFACTYGNGLWRADYDAVGSDPWPYGTLRVPSLVFEGVQFSGA